MSKSAIGILALVILSCLISYLIGKGDGSGNKSEDLQPKIDSLKALVIKKDNDYKVLSDSLVKDTQGRTDNIELINTIKKAIRNEIKNNTKEIFALNDSSFRAYIDSIRTSSGFR